MVSIETLDVSWIIVSFLYSQEHENNALRYPLQAWLVLDGASLHLELLGNVSEIL